jgi:predicted nucleic acid-binding protein
VRRWEGPIVFSALTLTEVTAAFWGKVHRGELSAELAAVLDRAFAADAYAGRFVVLGLSEPVVSRSLDVVRRHRLRGADALQLATAMVAREADASLASFAAFDTALRAAASAEQFALLPAS